MNRRWVAAAPALVGLASAAVLAVVVADKRLYVSVAPALLAAIVGVGVSAALLVADRRRERASQQRLAELARVAEGAEHSRRRFVTRLDHELKNPLTALLAALREPATSEGVVAQAQAHRIYRLLRDLRRVADIETVEIDRAPVDIDVLLRQAVESAVADAGGHRTVTVDVPAAPWPLPTVTGDADLLLVAVYNVIANSLKYTIADQVVEVRAREAAGPSVVLEVADTGPGIGEDEHQVVWEELARGRSGAGIPGSGVGLAMVRVIVTRHGGTVWLRSRLGHGTSVFLQLPAR